MFAPTVALALVGGIFFLTLRPGQDWSLGDDFAQYILHARNIAEARAYASTGYIYNPDLAVIGPPAYPPVFPLALAPVWAVFGLNLLAMKTLVVAFFVGALALASELMRPALSPLERGAIIAIVGLNPYFWDFKDAILSDFPFMFFAFAALVVAARLTHSRSAPAPLWQAACLGCALYLAYGTRVAGIALAVAVVAFDVLTLRRLRRATLVALVIFGALAGAQQLLIPGVDAYLGQLAFDPAALPPLLLANAGALGAAFSSLWTAEPSSPLALGALLAAAAVVAGGYLLQIKRDFTIVEVLGPAYLALIVAWPHGHELRFLFPLVPLAVYYGWLGLRALPIPDRLRVQIARPLFGGLVAAVLLAYAARYVGFDYGPIRSGIAAPDTQALFAFVRDQTNPADVIVFRRPRALALFTGRASGPYSPGSDRRDAWTYLRDIGAGYVVAAPQDQRFWSALAAQSPDLVTPVYRNQTFVAYHIRMPPPGAPLPPPVPGPTPGEDDDL
ncbi:MAG: hypothetical protein M3069_01225 [Chloroflexota bacterium]|nr:hypothetical protein [Chloroflexota bacterium]